MALPRFKERAVDRRRLHALLDGDKDCRCARHACFRVLANSLDAVLEFVTKFNDMDKLDQDQFATSRAMSENQKHVLILKQCSWLLFTSKMHSLGSQQPAARRRSYEFLGQAISLDCLACLLGVGKKRMLKAMAGRLDMRFAETGGSVRRSPKTDSIDRFLYQLHSSVAETLPSGLLVSSKSVCVCVCVCLCLVVIVPYINVCRSVHSLHVPSD